MGALQQLRNHINSAHSRLAQARERRRFFRSRTLLIADHWDGSVQQFYHFMLGYFVPMCTWLDKYGDQPIVVRDCGPMNIWLEALRDSCELQVVPPGSALHMLAGKHMKHVVLRGLDDPGKFHQARLRRGAQAVERRVRASERIVMAPVTKIVVIDRASSEGFYHQAESETEMSGQERRSVPNLAQLPAFIDLELEMEVVDLARKSPKEQIQLMKTASVLVGQHGAGLVHMLWMSTPGLVIEIAPPLPPQVAFLFQQLALTLGHEYVRIRQANVHAPVDLQGLAMLLQMRNPQTEATTGEAQ